MTEYPFDEKIALIDRQAFAAFSRYFPLLPRPEVDAGKKYSFEADLQRHYDQGNGVFDFSNGWNTLTNIPLDELCALAPFLFTYGDIVFHRFGDYKDANRFNEEKVLPIMRERGVTPEIFLQYMDTFEFDAIGPETAQFISGIRHDLESGESRNTYSAKYNYSGSIMRYRETKEKLKTINKTEKEPFTLESVLSFEYEPVCLRYADDGRLYVLDEKAELHEFTNGEKTNHWKLWLEDCDLGRKNMMLGDLQVFPNIAVSDGYVFVANGDMELRRFNTTKQNRFEEKNEPDAICSTRGISNNLIHDVILRDGNVLVSMSDRHAAQRYIGQLEDTMRIVYSGRYPISHMRSSGADYTLRLDLHRGHLFFPRGNGISLYKGFGSTGQPPKEMIEEHKREEKPYGVTSPISKFSFGDTFMVAQAHLEGFELPMLSIFRPVYETDSTELLPAGVLPPPTRLDLEHVCYPPKFTGVTLMDASIAAHGDRFAMTNSAFRRVYVYKVDGSHTKV